MDISQCFALSAITAWQSEWFFSLYVDHFEFPMFWPALLKIYRCFCGKLAEYTVISVYRNKWIKFHIHFSAVFPDCLGAKGSIRRLAPTTELEFRVCWLGLLASEIEINTSAAWKAPEARVARFGRFLRCLWQNMRNLINNSWKKCKNFRFFCFLLPRTHWYTHQSDADYMLNNSIENFEAWKIDLHGGMAKNAKQVRSTINYVNFAFSLLRITAQPVWSLVLLKNIVVDLAIETQVSQREPQKDGYSKNVRIGPEHPTIHGYIRF